MKETLLYILLSLIFPVAGTGQDSRGDTEHLKLIFAGDIMGHDSQIHSALDESTGQYTYDTCFSLLKPFIDSADIAIANLEVTLAGPVYKGYPQFSSPDELADAVKRAGFDIMINANNHCLDRGKQGLERTIEVLDRKGIIHTGTFRDENERSRTYPLIVEKNGIRLALLNYTYGTNGLKVQDPNIVNYTDTSMVRQDLDRATLAEPDFTIVTIHWGIEYQRTENKQQDDMAAFILDHGADAIIGSHPHVVQPVKMVRDTTSADTSGHLVVFSLGNFISNQRNRYTDGGIITELDLEKTGKGTTIHDYSYLPVWVWKPAKKVSGNYFVLVPASTTNETAASIGMQEKDLEQMHEFFDDTRKHLMDVPLNSYRVTLP